MGKGVKSRQTAVTAGDVQPRATSATCHSGSSLPKKITFCCTLGSPASRIAGAAIRIRKRQGRGAVCPASRGHRQHQHQSCSSCRGSSSSFWPLVHPCPAVLPGEAAPPSTAAASPQLGMYYKLAVCNTVYYYFFWSTSPIRKCKKIPSACQLTHV